MNLYDILWIILGIGALVLAWIEIKGWVDRKEGWTLISEQARKSWKLRTAILLGFLALAAWWFVHSCFILCAY